MSSNILPIIGAAATAVGAIGTGLSLFSKSPKEKKIKTPTLKPVTPMPTMDTEAVRRTQIAELQRRQSSSGRQSTILTGDTLG